jgi:hypothetical protein
MAATNSTLWLAPFRGKKPVDVQVTIPGSKSVTNRALILAAQAVGTSKLRKPLVSRDSELMVAGLRALGIKINETKSFPAAENHKIENQDQELVFEVTGGALKGPAKIDVGNAGTVMRFLPPLAALADGAITFDGDPRSHERPLGPVIKALNFNRAWRSLCLATYFRESKWRQDPRWCDRNRCQRFVSISIRAIANCAKHGTWYHRKARGWRATVNATHRDDCADAP